NTKVYLNKPNGDWLGAWTGGSAGFKNSNRSSYEAGYQCAVQAFEAVRERAQVDPDSFTLSLVFKGNGQGREAVQKAFLSTEGDHVRSYVTSVEDRTSIKMGGTRAKKTR
ncbi:translational machinery component, partial [Coniophora puteana RWD-64-598 SS2]